MVSPRGRRPHDGGWPGLCCEQTDVSLLVRPLPRTRPAIHAAPTLFSPAQTLAGDPPILGSPVTGQTQQLWLRTARQTWHRGARGTACLSSPQLSGGPVSPACWPLALKIRARSASPRDTLRIQGPSGRAACLQAFQQALPWAAVPGLSSSLPFWGLLSHIQCRIPPRSESLWLRTPQRRVSAKTRNTPWHNQLLDFSQKKTKSISECSLGARSQFLSPRVQWFFSNCIWGRS